MARKRKKRISNFERIGNWLSLFLVLGAMGAAGFVWWRWVYRETRFDKLIVEVGLKYGVDPCLVKAVVRRESKFDPWVHGGHGEIGLMQVTEGAGAAWWRAVGGREALLNEKGVGGDLVRSNSVGVSGGGVGVFSRDMLWGARVNLEAGTWYLGRALGRWRGRGEVGVAMGLAEYNAGLGNALRWAPREGAGVEEAVGGITWPGVRDYVREVMESWGIYRERGM